MLIIIAGEAIGGLITSLNNAIKAQCSLWVCTKPAACSCFMLEKGDKIALKKNKFWVSSLAHDVDQDTPVKHLLSV